MRSFVLALVCSLLFSVPSAHAGDVIVTAKGGKLALKGSIDPDVVSLTSTQPNEITVTPGAGTTVNGVAAPEAFTVTGGITADLGAGADAFGVSGLTLAGDLKLKMGDGFDTVELLDVAVAGGIVADLGAGAASVALCFGTTGKGVTLKTGDAGPGVAHAVCTGLANADVANTDGVAAVFGTFTVGGGLTVKAKSGPAKLVLENSTVTENATLAFGDGTTLVGICDATVAGNLTVKMKNGTVNGSLECQVGMDDASMIVPHGTLLVGAAIGESFTMKGGKDGDVATVSPTSLVGEKVKLTLGNGSNIMSVGGTIGASLTAKGGKDTDILTSAAVVGDDLKATLGDGLNIATLTGAVGGDLTLTTGDGNDVINTMNVAVSGKKTIKPGGGTNTVQ